MIAKAKVFLSLAAVSIASTFFSSSHAELPYDFSTFVHSDPRSVVVAPVSGPEKTPGWFLSIIAQPLAERGYYVLPVRMTNATLESSGFTPYYREAVSWSTLSKGGRSGVRILEPEQFDEEMGKRAIEMAEFVGVDAVLFVQVLAWGHRINTSDGMLDNMIDDKKDHVAIFNYQLVDKHGQTLWRAETQFNFTRGGGSVFAEIWNASRKLNDNEIDMLLGRNVNRKMIENKASKMTVKALIGEPALLVGPYHRKYEADRARRDSAAP